MRTTTATLAMLSMLLIATNVGSQDPTNTTLETPTVEKLVGTYTYAGNREKDSNAVGAQIDNATANMGSFIRRKAKKKLEAVNVLVKRIEIATKGTDIVVTLDDWTVSAPADGSRRSAPARGGGTAMVSFHTKKSELIEEIDGGKGRRENTFRFNSKGQLVFDVKETSKRLSAPVEYKLLYNRTGT